MIRSFLIVLLIATPMLADPEEAARQITLDALQGDWGVKSMTVAGDTVDPARLKFMQYTINRDVLSDGNKPEEAVRLELDVSGPIPKFVSLDRYGNTREGVIQRRGDSVLMCFVKTDYQQERRTPPASFRSTKDNNATLMQMKRTGR